MQNRLSLVRFFIGIVAVLSTISPIAQADEATAREIANWLGRYVQADAEWKNKVAAHKEFINKNSVEEFKAITALLELRIGKERLQEMIREKYKTYALLEYERLCAYIALIDSEHGETFTNQRLAAGLSPYGYPSTFLQQLPEFREELVVELHKKNVLAKILKDLIEARDKKNDRLLTREKTKEILAAHLPDVVQVHRTSRFEAAAQVILEEAESPSGVVEAMIAALAEQPSIAQKTAELLRKRMADEGTPRETRLLIAKALLRLPTQDPEESRTTLWTVLQQFPDLQEPLLQNLLLEVPSAAQKCIAELVAKALTGKGNR
jgi:hypothetical protein